PLGSPVDLSGRSIISPRIGGVIADAVAIEVSLTEFAGAPIFRSDDAVPIDGHVEVTHFILNSPTTSARLAVESLFNVQGFPNIDPAASPTTITTLYSLGMPKPFPWMVSYTPRAASGFSGGPVLKLDNLGARLWAIHTHSFDADITVTAETGHEHSFYKDFGGGVPVRLLMKAIDDARGNSEEIIDVAP
ncbi:MAG TPA: hypothetical protein VM532_15555, partial [Burkholderiales bacterium]|nr:hypothetical protein [Burkholderiales bacterium]